MESKMSQQDRLLNYLETNHQINPLTAWSELGIYRLSDTVLKLRKKGHNIITEKLNVNNRWNEKCTVANYILER